jgi:hypothetical protein
MLKSPSEIERADQDGLPREAREPSSVSGTTDQFGLKIDLSMGNFF